MTTSTFPPARLALALAMIACIAWHFRANVGAAALRERAAGEEL